MTFTGDEIYLQAPARLSNNIVLEFTTPGASIEAADTPFDFEILNGATFRFRSDQTIRGIAAFDSTRMSVNIESIDGGMLDMAETAINLRTRGTANLASVRVEAVNFLGGGSFAQTMNLNGDMEIVGGQMLSIPEGIIGHGQSISLAIAKLTSSTATFNTNGHNITSTSDGLVLIGREEVTVGTTTFEIRKKSGDGVTLDLAGDLYIMGNAVIQADADTVIRLRGNAGFNLLTTNYASIGLGASTLELIGSADASNPQMLVLPTSEHSTADGNNLDDTFFLANLVIGQGVEDPTYVRLDRSFLGSLRGDNLLEVGSLMVHEGSVLDLNFLNLYVNGELVTPGTGEFGDGLIVIPEPSWAVALLALLALLALITVARRRIGQGVRA